MMLPSSSLIISLFLLATPSLANDGQYHAAGKDITVAPAAAVATPAAGNDWQMIVTWPAGCESWANPCPPGAKIAGGSIAGGHAVTTNTDAAATGTAPYENGFTSYTTMTDSLGVITGMPSKATIPAGVSDIAYGASTHAANASTTFGTRTSTKSNFTSSTSTSRPSFSNAASPRHAVAGAALFGVVGVVAALW